jgi:ribosomal protein S27E
MKVPFNLAEIKPGTFAYLTKRKLKNKEGEDTGEIIVWRKKGEEESQFVMRCPFCGVEQEGSTVFTRRPYRVRCADCNRSITLPKILNEAKKKK